MSSFSRLSWSCEGFCFGSLGSHALFFVFGLDLVITKLLFPFLEFFWLRKWWIRFLPFLLLFYCICLFFWWRHPIWFVWSVMLVSVAASFASFSSPMAFAYLEAVLGEFLLCLLILRGVLFWFLRLLILCFSPWSRNHEVLASSFLEFFWLRKWWIRFASRFFYSFIEIVSCSGDNIRLVCLVRNVVSLCCWSIVSWVASCSWWFEVCLLLLVFLLWWFVNLGLSGD